MLSTKEENAEMQNKLPFFHRHWRINESLSFHGFWGIGPKAMMTHPKRKPRMGGMNSWLRADLSRKAQIYLLFLNEMDMDNINKKSTNFEHLQH